LHPATHQAKILASCNPSIISSYHPSLASCNPSSRILASCNPSIISSYHPSLASCNPSSRVHMRNTSPSLASPTLAHPVWCQADCGAMLSQPQRVLPVAHVGPARADLAGGLLAWPPPLPLCTSLSVRQHIPFGVRRPGWKQGAEASAANAHVHTHTHVLTHSGKDLGGCALRCVPSRACARCARLHLNVGYWIPVDVWKG